jgi:hypothetical protein
MAIIDDFKALSDALGRIQGRIAREAPNPLPCGQAPMPAAPPGICGYCSGSRRVPGPNGKSYPCPKCNSNEEVSFLRGSEMTDDERLEWCKQRALKYLDQHDVKSAIASMMADMCEYNVGTKNGAVMMLGIMVATRDDEVEARRWIVGFR